MKLQCKIAWSLNKYVPLKAHSSMFMLFFLDFNEDDYICENDLKKMITKLCGEQRLTEESIQNVIDKVCIAGMTLKHHITFISN